MQFLKKTDNVVIGSEVDAQKIAAAMVEYYRSLGGGDLKKGVTMARRSAMAALIDCILNSETVDQETKDRTYYTKVSLDFIDGFERIYTEQL